jgi:hypothetical protein
MEENGCWAVCGKGVTLVGTGNGSQRILGWVEEAGQERRAAHSTRAASRELAVIEEGGEWSGRIRKNRQIPGRVIPSASNDKEGAIMKKTMMIAACGLAVLLTMGLCVTGLREALAVCPTCPQTATVTLTPESDTANADSGGVFSGAFYFAWAYPEDQPDYIVMEVNDNPASTNIVTDVPFEEGGTSYSPSLVTNPDCCEGSFGVTIDGHLDNHGVDGTLQSTGWASTPYREDTHTLVVHHS